MNGHPVSVVVLAYPEVDELDLFGAYSVLSKAAPSLTTRIVADHAEVTGSGGVTFRVAHGIDEVPGADAVVVPGGRGAQAAATDQGLRRVLRAAARSGSAFYGVCSGALLIAAAGLAQTSRIAVHHAKRDLVRVHPVGGVVSGLVRDGSISTVGGDQQESVKSVDLAFALLADFAPEMLAPVAERMEIWPGRRVS